MKYTYVRLGIIMGLFSGAPFLAADKKLFEPFKSDDILGWSDSGISKPVYVKKNHIEYAQYPVEPQGPHSGDSGYRAVHNALISLKLTGNTAANEQSAKQFKNIDEYSLNYKLLSVNWRLHIIEFRKKELATQYLKDLFTSTITGAKKIGYDEITSFNFAPLYLEQAVVVFEKNGTARNATAKIVNLIPAVAKALVNTFQGTHTERRYTISRESIFKAFEHEIKAKSQKSGSDTELIGLANRAELELYFPTLTDLHFSIESAKNENKLIVDGKNTYTQKHGSTQESEDGDWLSESEMQELISREKKDSDSSYTQELQETAIVECLEFPLKNEAEKIIHLRKLLNLTAAIEKNNKAKAIIFISIDGQWISCVLSPKREVSSKDSDISIPELIKSKPKLSLIVTDSLNKDRSNDEAIVSLMSQFDKTGSKPQENGKNDFFDSFPEAKKPKKTDDKKEEVNYDHPLKGYTLKDLPSLESLFGGTIPNDILVRIEQLKQLTKDEVPTDKKRKMGSIIKNCTLFYGPPGTGKTTISYVMYLIAQQQAGHEIEVLSAGGGDFRDAYQGSGKAKLDALFDKAVNSEHPCIIMIDEIDGTSSKLEQRQSTQEDNRAIKTLITTLDKYRYHKGIYVICTTNYPEKIDPAILRRFSSFEIPLPDYEMRRHTLEYYLKVNDVEIDGKNPNAVSPAFLEMFATATQDMSGDALNDIINNAVHQLHMGSKPQVDIDLSFRFNAIDLHNRSIASNIAPLLSLPWIPFMHIFNKYKTTDLDKHIYAQYARHMKLKRDLEGEAKKKALEDYKAKQLPRLARWAKIAENATVSHVAVATAGAFIGAGALWAAKKLYKEIYHKSNGNVQIPWVPTPPAVP